MKTLREQAELGLEALDKGYSVPQGMIDPVKRYGSKESIMLKCMLPIAAQVSQEHLRIWFNIVRELDAIVEAREDDIEPALKGFLKHIKEFSELSER